MIADLGVYRSANELIKQFGDAADIEAAMRADEFIECQAAYFGRSWRCLDAGAWLPSTAPKIAP